MSTPYQPSCLGFKTSLHRQPLSLVSLLLDGPGILTDLAQPVKSRLDVVHYLILLYLKKAVFFNSPFGLLSGKMGTGPEKAQHKERLRDSPVL
jgi:hypothetical protein